MRPRGAGTRPYGEDVRVVRDRVALGAFAVTCVLAGGNAVGVRFSNRELDPLWGAAVRYGAAAAVLLLLMAVQRLAWPRGRALAGAVLFGVLNFGVTFGLAYYALVHIHAGLAQTLLALVPLVALLLSVAQHQERFSAAALSGTLCATRGVGVVSRATVQADVAWPALLAALGAVLSLRAGGRPREAGAEAAPRDDERGGDGAAAVLLFAGSLAAGDAWVLPDRAATWWALAYLVVAGSVLTFVSYVVVIERWGPSRAAYVFVVIPVVTIAASAWLDDEPLTPSLLVGAPLILLGVYLGALRAPPPAGAAPRTDRRPRSRSAGGGTPRPRYGPSQSRAAPRRRHGAARPVHAHGAGPLGGRTTSATRPTPPRTSVRPARDGRRHGPRPRGTRPAAPPHHRTTASTATRHRPCPDAQSAGRGGGGPVGARQGPFAPFPEGCGLW